MRRAQLLRWRPRQPAQRTERPSPAAFGRASQLDPSHRSSPGFCALMDLGIAAKWHWSRAGREASASRTASRCRERVQAHHPRPERRGAAETPGDRRRRRDGALLCRRISRTARCSPRWFHGRRARSARGHLREQCVLHYTMGHLKDMGDEDWDLNLKIHLTGRTCHQGGVPWHAGTQVGRVICMAVDRGADGRLRPARTRRARWG